MSYVYSNGLCHEALRLISSDDDFESRLVRAFSEMGVANYGDTSDEIWTRWTELQEKYQILHSEIYKRRQREKATEEMISELKQCGQTLVALICDWMEFNYTEIAHGKLFNKKAMAQ